MLRQVVEIINLASMYADGAYWLKDDPKEIINGSCKAKIAIGAKTIFILCVLDGI